MTLRISRSWCSHVLSNVVGARGSPLALVAFLEQAILRRARGLGRVAFRAWLTAVEQAVEERQEVACRQGWGVRSEAIIAYRQRGDIRGRCGEVLAMWREAARGQRWSDRCIARVVVRMQTRVLQVEGLGWSVWGGGIWAEGAGLWGLGFGA